MIKNNNQIIILGQEKKTVHETFFNWYNNLNGRVSNFMIKTKSHRSFQGYTKSLIKTFS